MDDDQQFCLRWNNHQSTLISVFDTLLENETLVDCTLAAEGKFLKAHKVVLSACSPYFATLLSEQYDKHPIFILKDVKYQELRAMMDYMYRGEVNISQDQLAALLKAAESLQIKGLSDNRTGSGNNNSGLGSQQQQKLSAEQQHKHISVPGKLMAGSAAAGYTLEQTKRSRIGPASIDSQDLSGSREGSSSPTSRRRKKVRRRSIDNVMADNHDNSNSSQVIQAGTSIVPTTNATGTISAMLPMSGSVVAGTTTIAGAIASTVSAATSSIQQQQTAANAAAAAATTANIITANVTKKTESVKMGGNTDAMNAAVDNMQDDNAADSIDEKEMLIKDKQNHKRPKHQHDGGVVATSSSGKDEIVIEPKSEYDDDGNDETVEDLTLDDEEMGLEDLDHNAGPSHGGEGSSQGYGQWQVDRSQDEVFLAAQEAQQRDPQGNDGYWTILETVPYTLSDNVSSQNPSTSSGNSHNAQTDNDMLATATVVVEIPSDSIGMAPSTIKYTIPKADPPVLHPKPIITTTIPGTKTGGTRIQLIKKLPTVPKPITITQSNPLQKKEPIKFVNHQVDVIEQCLASAQVLDNTSNIELGAYEIQEQQPIKSQEVDPLAEPQFKFKSKLRQELEAIAAEKKRKREALAALLPTETKEEREHRRQIRRQAEMVRRGRVITTNCLNEHIVDFEEENPEQHRTDEEKFMSIRQASIREPNGMYVCSTCGKSYKIKGSLRRHLNYECGVTPTLSCRYCPHKSKYKSDLRKHIVQKHANIDPDII